MTLEPSSILKIVSNGFSCCATMKNASENWKHCHPSSFTIHHKTQQQFQTIWCVTATTITIVHCQRSSFTTNIFMRLIILFRITRKKAENKTTRHAGRTNECIEAFYSSALEPSAHKHKIIKLFLLLNCNVELECLLSLPNIEAVRVLCLPKFFPLLPRCSRRVRIKIIRHIAIAQTHTVAPQPY